MPAYGPIVSVTVLYGLCTACIELHSCLAVSQFNSVNRAIPGFYVGACEAYSSSVCYSKNVCISGISK
jgi:hypothetical protein